MTRQKAHVTYNNFVKGLITEASDINFPPQASLDESNCVLFRKGNRRRRLGIDYVAGTTLSTDTFSLPSAGSTEFSYYRWKAPAAEAAIFLVCQIGSKLYFHDDTTLTLISEIDLTIYAISGATNIQNDKVKMVSSRGKLFVVGRQLQPFFVTFTTPSTLTVTSITLQIRDFVGVDDGLAVNDRPPTLTPEHQYNLYNQGWFNPAPRGDVLSTYFGVDGVYPSNNLIWYLGRTGAGGFDTTVLNSITFPTTLAPKGHYIVNPFDINYSTVSGIPGLTPVTSNSRPTCVASFAGRMWYSGVQADGFSGIVYFSQILNTDISNAGNCYQAADPTDENDSALVDNDGGTIPIADIGKIINMIVAGDTLCIFATNGVWGITGDTGSTFKATSFSVYQITNVELSSVDSICAIESQVLYWSHKGIYAVVRDSISGRFNVQSITQNTIQSLFLDITPNVRTNVQAIYDEKGQQVIWLYSSTDNDTSYKRNKMLLLDMTLQAFFKYDISDLASNSPFVIGAIDSENTTNWYTSAIRYLTAVPSSGSYKFIISEFNNGEFMDWKTKDGTGITYSSFLEAGYEYANDVMLNKQAPFINCYFEQTETAWVLNGDGGYDLVNPSSCFMQAKWDWANISASNRWSEEKQVYKLQRLQLPDTMDLTLNYGQNVIVTKNKIRGKGRAVRTRWRSEDGKDFNLLGWAALYTVESDV